MYLSYELLTCHLLQRKQCAGVWVCALLRSLCNRPENWDGVALLWDPAPSFSCCFSLHTLDHFAVGLVLCLSIERGRAEVLWRRDQGTVQQRNTSARLPRVCSATTNINKSNVSRNNNTATSTFAGTFVRYLGGGVPCIATSLVIFRRT